MWGKFTHCHLKLVHLLPGNFRRIYKAIVTESSGCRHRETVIEKRVRLEYESAE
jgi:hypothetical protein